MAFARARAQCLPFCCHDSSPAFPFSRLPLPLPGPSMQLEGDRSLRRLRSRVDILRKGQRDEHEQELPTDRRAPAAWPCLPRLRAIRGRGVRRGSCREPRAGTRHLHRVDAGAGGRRGPSSRTGHADAERRVSDGRGCRTPAVYRRRHRRQRNDRAHDGDAALRQSDLRVAGRRLRVSAAGEGRRRPSRDEDRTTADRGADPRARRGARRIRAGEDRGTQGNARRAGAPECLHDQRGAHRAGRGNHGHDRVPGDAALRHRRLPAALPDGCRAPLRPGHVRRRRRVRQRVGNEHRPGARRRAHHAAGRASRWTDSSIR